jgi:hypothetical protein
MPINAGMGEPGGVPEYGKTHEYGDTWDAARARDWDNLASSVPELLGVLGAAGRSPEEQRQALHEFTQTAPYVPCPFKEDVEQFLEAG